MMRPLVIDDAARERSRRVIAYAEAHPWQPFAGGSAPGDNPNHTADFGTYRVVFTFTLAPDAMYRHLSISVPSKDYPHPVAVYTLADLFGFTGWDQQTIEPAPDGWLLNVNENEHCIVVAQEVSKAH